MCWSHRRFQEKKSDTRSGRCFGKQAPAWSLSWPGFCWCRRHSKSRYSAILELHLGCQYILRTFETSFNRWKSKRVRQREIFFFNKQDRIIKDFIPTPSSLPPPPTVPLNTWQLDKRKRSWQIGGQFLKYSLCKIFQRQGFDRQTASGHICFVWFYCALELL